MRLEDLIVQAGLTSSVVLHGDGATPVIGITHDSRAVEPGWLFCALPGAGSDGHDFVEEARRRGATALLLERALDVPLAQLVVPDSRRAMAPMAAALFGHPSHDLVVVAVTGTNGKTTTASLMGSIWKANGVRAGVIGTLSGQRTTPESTDLQRSLAAWRDGGATAVVLEATSIGLLYHRLDAVEVAVAIFTNLSQDHLDVHGTMERYFGAKAMLFEPLMARRAVVNVDDRYGQLLFDAAQIPTVGYSLRDARSLLVGPTGSTFWWHDHRVELPMGGRYNMSNALAAATAALELGLDPAGIAAGLSAAAPIAGRFEAIDAGQPFTVLVDYAHTPDGLRELLLAVREIAEEHRVIVVFGCGGDRDATKRPAMGEVAARLADVAVITSDNPRREDPDAIISNVLNGTTAGRGAASGAVVMVEPDRQVAIGWALAEARDGDVVVIAGKGHETTQIIGDRVLAFDDRQVVREELNAIGWEGRQ